MLAIPSDLQAALDARYAIERVVGRGGMATVYLARDRKHGRQVAVKVLRPDLAASLGTDRFLKEIEIAARLAHPMIVPLYDSGEAGGFLFYVMPYVAGESLRALLNRERALAPAHALEIAAIVGHALDYAHRMGVVHRDIKPENVLLAEGHPVVADFGIAKAVSTAGGANLTRTGYPVGTPGYMSPEQAAGLGDLDARSDIYSLACVCYEMTTGELLSRLVTSGEERAGRFVDAPTGHRRRLAELPGGVEAALVRALAIRREDRFESVAAFRAALSATPAPRRAFDTGEARDVIARAAVAQAAKPTGAEGMSLETLEEIGGEVGLSRRRIHDALGEPAGKHDAVARHPFLGGPTLLVAEREIDAEATDQDLGVFIAEIRSTLRVRGHVTHLGRGITWSSQPPKDDRDRAGSLENLLADELEGEEIPDIQVRIVPRSGKTLIRVEQQLSETVGVLYGLLMFFGGGGGATAGVLVGTLSYSLPALTVIAGAAGIVAGSYGIARSIYPGMVRRRRTKLEQLLDRLEGHLAAATETPPTRVARHDSPQPLTPNP